MSARRLAVVTTHPVQYYAPVFRRLARTPGLQLRVFYTWSQTAQGGFFDREFATSVQWDVPLLDGYEHEFVTNVAARPGVERFDGIDTPALCPSIRRWRADAVLVHGWNNRAHLRAMREFKGRVPVFFRGDSTLLDRRSWARTLARRVALRWVYAHVDTALCVGRNSRDYFAWCGIPDERIEFAPHCVDTERFADPEGRHQAQAAQWRASLGIEPQEVVFTFAGKFVPVKNPTLLLRAFQEARLSAHLVFVGSGALEGELRGLASGMTNVHFMPFQNQSRMPAVYRIGDVFVLPSSSETWGLALNEAMASGRPVIASDRAGATRDLVRDGSTGWSFAADDVHSLAGRLSLADRSARDRATHATLGARATALMEEWSVARSADAIAQAVLSRIAVRDR